MPGTTPPSLVVWVAGAGEPTRKLVADLDRSGHTARRLSAEALARALEQGPAPDVVLRVDGVPLPQLPRDVIGITGTLTHTAAVQRLDRLARWLAGRDRIRLQDGWVDPNTGRVVRRGEVTELTHLERRLLAALAARPGEVVARSTLLEEVWEGRSVSTRAISMTVRRLRAKVEVDPGTPRHVQAVYGAGYRFDPATTGPPGGVAPLPHPRSPCLGRDALIEAAFQALRPGPARVLLHGRGGAGKSRLALAIARQWSTFHGPALWVALEGARTAGDVARALASTAGVAITGSEDPAAASARVARAIADLGDPLLVLDGIEHLGPALWPLLHQPALERLRTLLTSRVADGSVDRFVEVGPLATHDARRLLADRVQAARGTRPDPSEHAALASIVERLEGLPLALELAGARAAVLSLDALTEVVDRPEILRRPGRQGDRGADLDASIDWSWRLLSATERDTLGAAAAFHGPFALDTLAGLLDSDRVTCLDSLQTLVQHHLVRVSDGPDRQFTVHPTVRRHVRHRVGDEALAMRHARWFAHRARRWLQDAMSLGGVQATQALTDSITEISHALATARAHLPREVGVLALAAGDALSSRGPLDEAFAALDRAERALPRTASDHHLHRMALRCRALYYAGRRAEAAQVAERAVARARDQGSPTALAGALINLGGVHPDPRRRCDVLEQARDPGIVQQEPSLRARHLLNHGIARAALGDAETAIAMLHAAAEAWSEAGLPRMRAAAHANLGRVHLQVGGERRAAPILRDALETARRTGEHALAARAAAYLALALYAAGRLDDARSTYHDALALAAQVGDPIAGAQAQATLALLLAEQERPDEAREHALAAVDKLDLHANPPAASLAFAHVVAALHIAGHADGARSLLARAEQIPSGDHPSTADLLATFTEEASPRAFVRVAQRALAASETGEFPQST